MAFLSFWAEGTDFKKALLCLTRLAMSLRIRDPCRSTDWREAEAFPLLGLPGQPSGLRAMSLSRGGKRVWRQYVSAHFVVKMSPYF